MVSLLFGAVKMSESPSVLEESPSVLEESISEPVDSFESEEIDGMPAAGRIPLHLSLFA
jgi:hypothetical protein